MRIQLPQAVKSPDVVALEIPSNQTKYDQETGTWTFQVFGVSADGDVSTLKVQALSGDIKRFELETVKDSDIDAFLLTEQGNGQTRTQASVAIALGNLYAFALTPASIPEPTPEPTPEPEPIPEPTEPTEPI